MSKNGQTHFKNLAANAVKFLSVCEHFETLWIKGLSDPFYEKEGIRTYHHFF